MKTGYPLVQRLGLIAAALINMVATAPLSAADAADDGGKEPKGATTIVLEHPMARVHEAAVNALAVIGCKIRKNEAAYLEGKRSNKVGLVVGSGGEMIKIWLTADDANTTTVKIATVKTMMGYAGQRSWNAGVLEEINKELGSAAAPATPEPTLAPAPEPAPEPAPAPMPAPEPAPMPMSTPAPAENP